MMPDAKLSIVGECVAQVTAVVGWTRERNRLVFTFCINNGVYTASELAGGWVEVDAAEVVMKGIELQAVLGDGMGCTEI